MRLRKSASVAGQSTPAAYAPYAVAEMGEDVCAPAVCGSGVWYAVGRYNIRESIIGNLFVIYLVF